MSSEIVNLAGRSLYPLKGFINEKIDAVCKANPRQTLCVQCCNGVKDIHLYHLGDILQTEVRIRTPWCKSPPNLEDVIYSKYNPGLTKKERKDKVKSLVTIE